jgi:DNA-nicking Smr family endonuclease
MTGPHQVERATSPSEIPTARPPPDRSGGRNLPRTARKVQIHRHRHGPTNNRRQERAFPRPSRWHSPDGGVPTCGSRLLLYRRGELAVSGTGRPRRCGAGEEEVVKLKLDLHEIYNRGGELDHALRAVIDEAIAKRAPLVEIIPGKGSGALKERALRFPD